MSVDVLRAAATKLREAAEGATEGPWRPTFGMDSRAMVLATDKTFRVKVDGHTDATYIALANPLFGLAVADWLDATANTEASYFDDSHALAVARSIIGDPS